MSGGRLEIRIGGAVQGVGFRPFVYRLATELGLTGRVRNDGSRVVVEAQGVRVAELERRIRAEHPPQARIDSVDAVAVAPRAEGGFRIEASRPAAGAPDVVPDTVPCRDCLREVFDPASRYHGYAFTNCARCGPRYSIVERVPYDRAHTTMARFAMCAGCRAAYADPADRRFHAQPTACRACGPRLCATDAAGRALPGAPLARAAEAVRTGRILALKGLGGFQLVVDATDAAAVARLRARKHRPHKPLAVMVGDLAAARRLAVVGAAEARLLASAAGPIVLLAARPGVLPASVAADLATVGVMLPSTPLHHLLLDRVDGPVVCTSGNRSGEPLATGDAEALERLGDVADLFLLHDRPIRRAVDDAVARVVDGAPQVLRLGRGYAPLVLPLATDGSVLACGAHLKNALVVAAGGRAVLGQHVGDLETTRAVDTMRATAADLQAFFAVRPARAAADLHPDYASSRFAAGLGVPVTAVPHHLAHALALMAEHDLRGPLLAVAWDGAGLGPDGTVWGGEFLRVARTARGVRWERVASLHPFRLPGGDAAARDARRALAGLAFEVPALRARARPFERQLERGLNAPWSTSAGRLFDGVAALLGLCGRQTYEGQAAARLETAAAAAAPGAPRMPLARGRLDWRPLLAALDADRARGVSAGVLAGRFHDALTAAVVDVARAAGEPTVVLTGGCFQNRALTERALARLRAAGFAPRIARRVPPNDGGIALGQAVAAAEGSGHVPRGSR